MLVRVRRVRYPRKAGHGTSLAFPGTARQGRCGASVSLRFGAQRTNTIARIWCVAPKAPINAPYNC